MSGRPRSLRLIRLDVAGFGRLRNYVLEPEPVPGALIVAPNEAGKSTVAAAIYHGLFGFADKSGEDLRRPWEGGDYRVTLEWDVGGGRTCAIERDFDTQEVVVEWRVDRALERRWEGEPNPRGRSSTRDAYDAELKRILGFISGGIFHQTAFIGPGDPGVRPLAGELLRLLSGSERADFRAALAELKANYYDLTRLDIEDSGRTVKHKARRLEELAERRAELVRRREEAREVARRRRHAEERVERVRERLEDLDRELDDREEIRNAIERLDRLRCEIEAAEERRTELEEAAARFVDWEGRVRERTAELERDVRYLRFPDDFPKRARRIETVREEAREVEDRRRELRKEIDAVPGLVAPRIATLIGGLLALGGAVGFGIGAPVAAATALVVLGVGLTGVGAWWWRGRRRTRHALLGRQAALERRASTVEARRRTLASGLPSGVDLEDLEREIERFERARELRRELDLMQEMRKTLGDREATEREKRRVKEETLDVLRLERKRLIEAHPWLERDPDQERRVLAEIERGRRERERLQEEELEARGAAAETPLPRDDPHRLDAEIEALDEERERLELERDAYRLAWTTLTDCKDEFVHVMTQRLERRIGRVFEEMTEGRYHGVEIDPVTLELAVHGPDKRGVDAESLSRGARDQLYFALRVAVLQEFARDRALPLVLDDPFLHFDRRRLARVEGTLTRLGETHQILLLTHDTRLAGWTFPRRELPELSDRTMVTSGD